MHTRLLKCTLEVETSRAYWAHAGARRGSRPPAGRSRSTGSAPGASAAIEVLMANLRARYDAYPAALRALAAGRTWTRTRGGSSATGTSSSPTRSTAPSPARSSSPATRAPARPSRTTSPSPGWASRTPGAGTWRRGSSSRASSSPSAHGAGLIASNRDPRPLQFPRVGEPALTYLMYLLRGVQFEGTLLENPYLASVGLQGGNLEDRLRGLSALRFPPPGRPRRLRLAVRRARRRGRRPCPAPPRARAGGTR